MDDDYVLKYIPVMTDEGKQAHFGDPDHSPQEAIQYLTTDEVKEFLESDPEFTAYTEFSKNEFLNKNLTKHLSGYKEHQNRDAFKERLYYFLSQIKSRVERHSKTYTPLDAQGFKRDINRINKALAKTTFHKFFIEQYTAAIAEQLQKQNPDIDSFDAFRTASAIADFSENVLPLMQKAARDAWEYAEKYGEDRDKIDQKIATAKSDISTVLASLLVNYLNVPVKNSSKGGGVSKFDSLFIVCCEAVGITDVKPKSDHVKEAVRNLKNPLPDHLKRFSPLPLKTSKFETG